jgi:hypothetical protein
MVEDTSTTSKGIFAPSNLHTGVEQLARGAHSEDFFMPFHKQPMYKQFYPKADGVNVLINFRQVIDVEDDFDTEGCSRSPLRHALHSVKFLSFFFRETHGPIQNNFLTVGSNSMASFDLLRAFVGPAAPEVVLEEEDPELTFLTASLLTRKAQAPRMSRLPNLVSRERQRAEAARDPSAALTLLHQIRLVSGV